MGGDGGMMRVINKHRARCDFCKMAAIGQVESRRKVQLLCVEHFRIAANTGLRPVLTDVDVQSQWAHDLTEADVERLIRAAGDCVEAGIPCNVHKEQSEGTDVSC